VTEEAYGTVQAPNWDQPLFWVAFCTSIKMFFAPANPEVKLTARLNVRLFPDAVTDEVPAFTVHWLFPMVPDAPTVNDPCHAPASVAR